MCPAAWPPDRCRTRSPGPGRRAGRWASTMRTSWPLPIAAVSVPDADALLEVQVFDSGAAAGLPPPDALDQGRTNIEAALRHAAARLPPDRLKRVVLFSDGRETEGDTAAALAFLKEAGVRVFPRSVRSAERWRRLRERDPAPAGGARGRDDRGRGRGVSRLPAALPEIRVLADGEVLAAIEVELPPGASTVPVPVRVEEPGMTVLEAEIPGGRRPPSGQRPAGRRGAGAGRGERALRRGAARERPVPQERAGVRGRHGEHRPGVGASPARPQHLGCRGVERRGPRPPPRAGDGAGCGLRPRRGRGTGLRRGRIQSTGKTGIPSRCSKRRCRWTSRSRKSGRTCPS